MVRVVDVGDHVGDGELQLMRPQPAGLVAGTEIEARAEIEKNVGGLRDDEAAGFQKRRRIGRARGALVFKKLHHCRHAAFAGTAGNVDVVGAGLFERQPDELAAALNGRPVVKLIAHGSAPALDVRSASDRCLVLFVADLLEPIDVPAVERFLDGDVDHVVFGPAPCQCFSFGGNHTTSPARTSRSGPPQTCTRPTPATMHKVCPNGWVCQLVRAPGSKRT